jgi:glycosyltransferase involved in cell wall biosynthesis
VILFLGHLSFAKGYCDLLKVIPKIAEKHPGIRFCFAGTKIKQERNVHYEQTTGCAILTEDPDECYEQFVSKVCEKNHIYIGTIGESEKIKWLRECNFLVLPSYSEGFSMSVLEALTMGKPVICTPVGALGEIVKDEISGLLISPGTIQELEQAIDRMLSDSDLRNRIAENNYAYARQTFSKKIISRQLSDCFNQLLKEN